MNFSNIKNLTIPEGSVTALRVNGIQLWSANKSVHLTITGSYSSGYQTAAKATVNGVVYDASTSEVELIVPTGTIVNLYAANGGFGGYGWIKVNDTIVAQGTMSSQNYPTHDYDYVVISDTTIHLNGTLWSAGLMGSGSLGQITITEEE